MKKPLPTSFVTQYWKFGWTDALWGVNHGWTEPPLLVQLAVQQLLNDDSASSEVALLAGLEASQDTHAVSIAKAIADSEPESDEYPATKWLYLALRWHFDNRKSRRDPLGDVEEIYCSFDYPAQIAHFVRYMPAQGYDPKKFTRAENEGRLFRSWEIFLQEEEARFTARGSLKPEVNDREGNT